eukprot:3565795-Rhodomonas_salina.1
MTEVAPPLSVVQVPVPCSHPPQRFPPPPPSLPAHASLSLSCFARECVIEPSLRDQVCARACVHAWGGTARTVPPDARAVFEHLH